MKYAIKVVDTKRDMVGYKDWEKTDRGWEAWVDRKSLWDKANFAFKAAMTYNDQKIPNVYYEVHEVDE